MGSASIWNIQSAFLPISFTLIAFAFALFILAYPPTYKKVSILVLAFPVAVAFTHQLDFAPSRTLCDTIGRFLYIWFAHMSYEVVILEFEPKADTKEGHMKLSWKSRLRQAYTVLFDRNHAQSSTEKGMQPTKKREKQHDLSRKWFVLYHVTNALVLFLAQEAWDVYEDFLPIDRSSENSLDQAYFFRRLTSSPSSLDPHELYFRLENTFDWCILTLFLYELYHSLFAILFVGILRLDTPEQWSTSLFGSLREAWSVRRYWGKHWHNYIYHSFSAHTKIVTRGWLGLERGRTGTRLVENGLVFLASGLAHSLVRWQQSPHGDIWCITIWYIAQMLPIILEGLIQDLWRKMRRRLGIKADDKRTNAIEKAVGYAWVSGWFMWSVPKYIYTREARTMALMERRYAATQEKLSTVMRNDTE